MPWHINCLDNLTNDTCLVSYVSLKIPLEGLVHLPDKGSEALLKQLALLDFLVEGSFLCIPKAAQQAQNALDLCARSVERKVDVHQASTLVG